MVSGALKFHLAPCWSADLPNYFCLHYRQFKLILTVNLYVDELHIISFVVNYNWSPHLSVSIV